MEAFPSSQLEDKGKEKILIEWKFNGSSTYGLICY